MVGNRHLHRGLVPSDFYSKLAAFLATRRMLKRIAGQFGSDDEHVVTCRALGQ
jgi:hypothetical protein